MTISSVISSIPPTFEGVILGANAKGSTANYFTSYLSLNDCASLHMSCRSGRNLINATYYGSDYVSQTEKVTAEYVKEKRAYEAAEAGIYVHALRYVQIPRISRFAVRMLLSKCCFNRLIGCILKCFSSRIKSDVNEWFKAAEERAVLNARQAEANTKLAAKRQVFLKAKAEYLKVMQHHVQWQALFVDAAGGWKKLQELSTTGTVSIPLVVEGQIPFDLFPNPLSISYGTAINPSSPNSDYTNMDFLSIRYFDLNSGQINAKIFMRFNGSRIDPLSLNSTGWCALGDENLIIANGPISVPVIQTPSNTGQLCRTVIGQNVITRNKLSGLFQRLRAFNREQRHRYETALESEKGLIRFSLQYFPSYLFFDPCEMSDLFGGWEQFYDIPFAKYKYGSTLTNENIGLYERNISYHLVRGKSGSGFTFFAIKRLNSDNRSESIAFLSLVQPKEFFSLMGIDLKLRTPEYACTQPEDSIGGNTQGFDKVATFVKALRGHIERNRLTLRNCGAIPKEIVGLLT